MEFGCAISKQRKRKKFSCVEWTPKTSRGLEVQLQVCTFVLATLTNEIFMNGLKLLSSIHAGLNGMHVLLAIEGKY